MLTLDIPENDYFIEENETYVHVKAMHLQMEHSLISVKKWEQKWHKPFLGKQDKTYPEILDYIRCMIISPSDVDMETIQLAIDQKKLDKIIEYIQDPMTATWFSKDDGRVGAARSSSEVVTAEIIYYWMIELGVPVEFQKWHLGQLLTLIKVISIKRSPSKKMSTRDTAAMYKRLNAERRAKMHSKG